MSFLIENSVPLSEVAKVLKKSEAEVTREARGLASVGEDWAGRPAVSVQDAQGLVSGYLRLAREADQANQAAQLEGERYVADRQRVWQEAWQEAHAKAEASEGGLFAPLTGRVRGGPEAGVKARKAAIKAVEQFEKRNPPPATVSPMAASLVREY